MANPPREGVQEDIAVCNRAGIRVLMITDDNGITASAIVKKIEIPNHENIITGNMIDNMSVGELKEKVKKVCLLL